jgi:integrase
LLKRADALLDERDCGIRKPNNDDVLRLRDACFFLLGLLTGMRCDELAGIEVNAGRTETKDGVTYNWVRSIEHKTKKGPVEYLMPSMGHEILRVMERWSAPLRVRLLQQLAVWEADRSEHGVAERLRRISAARADANRLFLRMPRSRAGIGTVSGIAWHGAMREFATAAGIEWQLAPHQLRRTYAWMFVRHRLGNMLFLKEQFKHSSVLMTQLYAANPRQDGTLYDELRDEMRSLKVDLIQHWLSDDVKLSGGAGRRIVALRANTFSDRKELIEETAETVRIRSNGHAWCLAQDDGCGGAGLYERSMRWMQQWMHRRLPCRHLERDLPTPS